MATLKLPVRQLILAGGFAVAAAAAPAVLFFAVPDAGTQAPSIAACPGEGSEDANTGACSPDIMPNAPQQQTSPGGLPEVNGIPCTGHNTGECIGLSESQQGRAPMPVPRSTISSSP